MLVVSSRLFSRLARYWWFLPVCVQGSHVSSSYCGIPSSGRWPRLEGSQRHEEFWFRDDEPADHNIGVARLKLCKNNLERSSYNMPLKLPWIFPGAHGNIQGSLAGTYATSECVIKFNGCFGTADIGVHVVHISRRDATSQCHGCSGPDDARGLCFNSLVIDHFSSLSTRSAYT